METKHTRGPWRVACSDAKAAGPIGGFKPFDACGCCDSPWINGGNQDERDANALLIAAAPELLSAAMKVVEMNRQHAEDQYGDSDKAETWACVVVLRSAIAKATGEVRS